MDVIQCDTISSSPIESKLNLSFDTVMTVYKICMKEANSLHFIQGHIIQHSLPMDVPRGLKLC